MPDTLNRLTRTLFGQEHNDIRDGAEVPRTAIEPVTRTDAKFVSLAPVEELMTEFMRRVRARAWSDDRAKSDAWLAPRLHFGLRLTRAEVSDRGMWLWLAYRFREYVEWR